MAVNIRIQIRGDTAENWETNNPVLLNRELGYDRTNNRIKVGDGINTWTSLPYLRPDVIDDLVSGGHVEALSAEQGKILKGLIDTKADSTEITTLNSKIEDVKNNITTVGIVDNLTSTSNTAALSANQGRVLNGLITSSKVTVENNLTSTSAVNALSANQGRILNGLITSNKVSVVNNLTSTSTTAALSAAQGKQLKSLIDAKQGSTSESWTFTLSSGSTVTKTVVLK